MLSRPPKEDRLIRWELRVDPTCRDRWMEKTPSGAARGRNPFGGARITPASLGFFSARGFLKGQAHAGITQGPTLDLIPWRLSTWWVATPWD